VSSLGVKIPTVGARALDPGLRGMARQAEAAGASTLWVSDHIVMTEQVDSPYPYSSSGEVNWDPKAEFVESMTACAWLAACTSRVSVGTAVLILPLRDPIQLAKTAASVDWLSGGRLVLGVGTGWYAEEFARLGRDFPTRGPRTSEAIEVLKACWTGRPEAFEGEFFRIEGDTLCFPTPVAPDGVPIMVGGMGKLARERAARLGDGWLALTRWSAFDLGDLGRKLADVHSLRPAGRSPLRSVLRIAGEISPAELLERAEAVAAAARLGFDEVAIDPPWGDLDAAGRVIGELREAIRG
jgi:probable F420-dependent oxidoreductase